MSRDIVNAVPAETESETLPTKRFNLNKPLLVKLSLAAAVGAGAALTIKDKLSGRSEGQGSEEASKDD